MKRKYIHFAPRTDAQKRVWAANVDEKIPVYGPQTGLDAIAVTKVQTAAQNIQTTVDTVEVKKRELEEAVAAKNQSLKEDIQIIQNYAAMMKRHENYREQIGSAMGFVGTSTLFDIKDLQPDIQARTFEGKVEISFNLQTMKSITIFGRLKGTTGWSRLGNDKASPYTDTRPLNTTGQAEIREYAAMYFDGKEEVGQMSKIISIAFAG